MKKLDIYIIKRFLSTFFFMLILLMIVAVVFDASENLDRFSQIPFGELMLDHYLNFTLYLANLFSALVVFLSVLLFTARMARDTEIVPMLSGGMSYNRFLVPYFVAATLLVIVSLGMNHFFLPNANKTRLAFEDKWDNMYYNPKNMLRTTGENKTVYIKQYREADGYIDGFRITHRDSRTRKLVSVLNAKEAYGDSISYDWTLKGVTIRYFGDDKMKHQFRKMAVLDTTFNFTMGEFAARPEISSTMTTPQLIEFIEREEKKGSKNIPYYKIELHQRTSYPMATYILTFLGVCIASRKSRDSIGVNMAIGLALALLYLFFMKMTTVAALNVGFSAFWAVWTPNLIFLAIAYFVYRRTPK